MAKSLIENAIIDFRNQMSQLKNITGMSDDELADLLDCSTRTVTNLRANPLSCSGEYILKVQAYLKREDSKRWI